MKLLVDTSALLALVLKNDQHHAAAAAFARANPSARFTWTDLCLAELATRLRARAGAAQAVAVVNDLLASRRYQLVLIDMELLRGALARMARLADQRLSLADCASFEIMERLDLDTTFTFDGDFRACGYEMLP